MKAWLSPLALAVSLAGCTVSSGGGPILDGRPIRNDGFAAIDQPTLVETLVVTPKTILEDSRCPMNVRCVWAGRAVIETRIDGAGWRETVNLTLGETYQTHGTSIALTSVQRERMAGTQLRSTNYRFGYEPR